MGRKKLVDKVLESIDEKDEKGEYIIVYDFYETKIPKEFYNSLDNLRDKGFLLMSIQRSVLRTNSKLCAMVIKSLVEYYKGTCRVFRIAEEL